MTDIVETLRKTYEAWASRSDGTPEGAEVVYEAASEIERLRQENAELALELHHYVSKEFEELGLPE